jgi:polysaccharide biosynthesis/export protein
MTNSCLKNSVLWMRISVLAANCLLLAACGGGSSLSSSPTNGVASGQFAQVGSSQPKVLGNNAVANANKVFADNSENETGSDDYKIAALDVLDVTVLGVPELSRTVQVSSSGIITLPLIKSVKAGGRTQAQVEQEIGAKLEATYLQSPQVSVFVKEYNSQRITVDGAVNKPGIYPTTGKVSLLQAIALGQGLNEVADPSGILVFRTVNKKRMAARFDIKQIRGGKINDPILQAGDIVMVDESSARSTWRDVKGVLPISGLFNMLAL